MATSQRCKVTFESTAAILTRYYVLVAPEGQRYAEVCGKVRAEFAKPDFDEGKELESLYWIVMGTMVRLVGSPWVPRHQWVVRSVPLERSVAVSVCIKFSEPVPVRWIVIVLVSARRVVHGFIRSDSAADVVIVDSEEAFDSAVSMLVPDQDGLLCLKLFVQSKPIASADGVRAVGVRGARSLTTKVSDVLKSNWQFRCKKCPLTFRTIRQLRGHQNAHSETRRLRQQAWTLKEEQIGAFPGPSSGRDSFSSAEIISPLAVFDKTHDKSLLAVIKSTGLDSSNASEEGNSDVIVRTPQKTPHVPEENGASYGFPCSKCDRVFQTVRQVRGHQAAHTATHWKRRPKALAETVSSSKLKTEGGHNMSSVDGVRNDNSSANLLSEGEGKSPRKSFPSNGKLSDGEFPCTKCDRVFQKIRQLRGHQAAHSVIHWKRRKNLERLAAESSLVNEPELEGDESEAIKSKVVSSPYDLPDDLQFPCTKCDRVFDTIRQMRGHQAAHTASHKKRRKSKGARSLTAGSSASLDKRRKQSVIAQLAAGSSSDVEMVTQSSEEHDGEKIPCPKCDRTFDTKRQLRGHQAMHSEKGKFMCQVCHCGFRTMDIMQAHEDQCTAAVDAPGPSREEKWSCVPACGKRFALKRRLTEHRVLCGFVYENIGDVDEEDDVDVVDNQPIVANGVVRVEDVANWIAREDDAKGILLVESVEKACTPVALEEVSPVAELPSSPQQIDEQGEKSEVVAVNKKRKHENIELSPLHD